jgi:hypothetical protein
MIQRRVLSLLLVSLLSACSTSEWVRQDVTAEQADREQIDCQRWAARETSLRAEGFYGPAYGPYGPFAGRRYGAGAMDPSGHRMLEEARLADFCMRAKGFQRARRD